MPVTEERIQTIEAAVQDLQQRVDNLISKLQFNQFVLANEQEMEAIKSRLDAAEQQISILQGQ